MELAWYGWTTFWIDVAYFVAFVVVGIAGVLMHRLKANRSAIKQLQEELADLTTRVAGCEHDLAHLPGHQEIGALHEKINGVDAALPAEMVKAKR